ncbi:MAG: RidA family protein [Verrucomicrobiales bacterium]|nr:RidA family protein [Verrucomicrobiales bacterium]
MSAEAKIKAMGLELPPAPPKGGVYKPVVVVNNLAYLSGHGPFQSDETYIKGRLGEDLTLEEGQAAARQCGLALLATIKAELGSLDRVKRVIKTLALVNSTNDFVEQPQTINGFSELFGEVFGDAGIGARSAMGTNVLPGNIAVEIEVILEIE